jgi:hypothetical protein
MFLIVEVKVFASVGVSDRFGLLVGVLEGDSVWESVGV